MPRPDLTPEIKRVRHRLGERLRTLRRAAKLSQEQLGERAQLDRKTISRLENGAQTTSVDQLTVIAVALGRKPVDLFRFREHSETPPDDGPALTQP